MTARAADRTRYDRATAHLDAPLAIVDLDAFDANADDLVRRAAASRSASPASPSAAEPSSNASWPGTASRA